MRLSGLARLRAKAASGFLSELAFVEPPGCIFEKGHNAQLRSDRVDGPWQQHFPRGENGGTCVICGKPAGMG